MRSARFWTVFVLLLATLVTLKLRGDTDRIPQSEPLPLFPSTIDGYTSQDVPLTQETLDVLGDGRFLNRVYSPGPPVQLSAAAASSTALPISLFIGYFPTQRSGQSIHSPQNCLPGAGWSFLSSRVIDVTGDDGKKSQVGEYLISDGTTRQVVLYWYRAHGRSIANDYRAKAYMMLDALRWNRTDGALIRVVTPVAPGEPLASAQQRAIGFTAKLTPLLQPFIPD